MEWLNRLFQIIFKAISTNTGELLNEKDDEEKSKSNTKEKVRHEKFKEIAKYIDDLIVHGKDNPFTKTAYKDFRESEGKNKSKDIDALLIRNGGSLSMPYCCFGLMDILRAVEIKFQIKFDLPKSGSTQGFFNRTKPEYKTSEPTPYTIGIYQKGDEYKGHAVFCLAKIDNEKFSTFEFNTSPDVGPNIERDGQGCYFKIRSVDGYGDMRMRGFVDIFKAIK